MTSFLRPIALLLSIITTSCILTKVESFTTASSSPPFTFHSASHTHNTQQQNNIITTSTSKTAINLFGKKATESSSGTTNSPTINGKPVKAKVGEKVSAVANRAKVKITYSCRKGDCGTCELMMNGMIVKACQAKITAGKCDMKTF